MVIAVAFFCVNCLTDWPEPFCDECGQNLMPRKSNAPDAHLSASTSEASTEGA